MSVWDERVKNHPVFKSLSLLEQEISSIDSLHIATKEDEEYLDRIRKFAKLTRSKLVDTDPLLISIDHLVHFDNACKAISKKISEYKDQHSIKILESANTYIDNVAAIFSIFHQSITLDELKSIQIQAVESVKSIKSKIETMTITVDETALKNSELQNEIDRLEQSIKDSQSRFDLLISEHQEKFQNGQENRSEHFTKLIEASNSTLRKTIDGYNTNFDEILSTARVSAENAVERIMEHVSHAGRLVEILSASSMSNGYRQTAEAAKSRTSFWRFLAVSIFLLWIFLASYFLWETRSLDFSWTQVIRQLIASTPFLLISGFAALQVSHHQRVERVYRKAELELASIEPFLATLSSDERNDVKRSLVDKFFGNSDSDVPKSEVKKVMSTVSDLTRTLRDLQTFIKR